MAKIAARLFRKPDSAEKAVQELVKQGYKAEEIGMLLPTEEAGRFGKVAKTSASIGLPDAGQATAVGPVAMALQKAKSAEEVTTALAGVLSSTEDAAGYYQFGVAIGGILVSVHVDEGRCDQASRILRSAEAVPEKVGMWAKSPGFARAERMTATDPVDAQMTGDFRRY